MNLINEIKNKITRLEQLLKSHQATLDNLYMDKLKGLVDEEMYKRIDLYGINSGEVLEISQTIDLLINADFTERNKNNEEQ